MPRERIQHGRLIVAPADPEASSSARPGEMTIMREYHPGTPIGDDERILEDLSLDVAWNREANWVQIAMEAPEDWWVRREASYTSGELSHRGVYSETLTRQQINHLIRTLRRARDAAYGADE